MASKREQFYKRRIAELEEQVAELLKANAGLTERVTQLAEKVAKLSRNFSDSPKPPSSNIVKPPKSKQSSGSPHQRGQPGHKGSICPYADRKPHSAFGRIMRWHRTWCPAWAAHTRVYGRKPLS